MRRFFSFNMFVFVSAFLCAAVTVACALMGSYSAALMGMCFTYTIVICKD